MRGRKLALFLSALLLLLFGLFPASLLSEGRIELVKGWIGKSRYAYTGELRIWHIDGGGVGMGNGSGFLSARAKEFERKNFGIYFTVEVMDEAEFAVRLQSGDRADLLSFSQGLMDSPEGVLAPLEVSALPVQKDLLASGGWNGRCYGIPYCYGGGVLVGKDEAIYAKGLTPPAELPDEEWLQAAREEIGAFALMRVGSLGGVYAAASERLSSAAASAFLLAPEGSIGAFLSGDAFMAVMDLKSLYELNQREQAGDGGAISVYSLGGMALAAQYIGLFEGMPEEKRPAAEGFLLLLLSEKSQQRLLEYWAFPTAAIPSDTMPNELRMAALWEEGKGETPLCLPAFGGKGILAELQKGIQREEDLEPLRRRLYDTCNRGR